ncbi:MAG: hypothetical protein MRJ92_10920 [Nitrospira sp.]|nr:hypothetical protein [Nitrospira sp.]
MKSIKKTLAAQPSPPAGGGKGRRSVDVPPPGIDGAAPHPLSLVKDGTTLRLKRGALPTFGQGGIQGAQRPKGRLLEPDRELLLYEEEVPREGARVTRTYQYARWIDGSESVSRSAGAKDRTEGKDRAGCNSMWRRRGNKEFVIKLYPMPQLNRTFTCCHPRLVIYPERLQQIASSASTPSRRF